MKSSIILTAAAWTLNLAIFTALAMPTEKTARPADPNDFEVTGILLPEVTVSSLPTCELPAIIVRSTSNAAAMPVYELPEVVIIAKAKPRA